MKCCFKALLLCTAAAFALSGCGGAVQITASAAPTATAAPAVIQTSVKENEEEPVWDPILCPACGSAGAVEQDVTYETEKLGKETCKFDSFSFEKGQVTANGSYYCPNCENIWQQKDVYILSRCPAHGDLVKTHTSELPG